MASSRISGIEGDIPCASAIVRDIAGRSRLTGASSSGWWAWGRRQRCWAPRCGGAFELQADELQRWRRDLFSPAQPRLYYFYKHTDARTGVIREAGVFSYDGSSPRLAAKLADYVRRRCRTRSSSSPMSVRAAWTESRLVAAASGPNSTGTSTKRLSPRAIELSVWQVH